MADAASVGSDAGSIRHEETLIDAPVPRGRIGRIRPIRLIDESGDLGRRGRQAGQVEAQAANERDGVGFGLRGDAFLFQPGENEVVDRISRPFHISHAWGFVPHDRLE